VEIKDYGWCVFVKTLEAGIAIEEQTIKVPAVEFLSTDQAREFARALLTAADIVDEKDEHGEWFPEMHEYQECPVCSESIGGSFLEACAHVSDEEGFRFECWNCGAKFDASVFMHWIVKMEVEHDAVRDSDRAVE
jgi:hypothetical protein